MLNAAPRLRVLVLCLAVMVGAASVSASIPVDPPQGRFHEAWMALKLGNQQMGYFNTQYIREGDDIHIVTRTAMKLARADTPIEVSVFESTVESITGQPKSFVSETRMAATPVQVRGTIVDGRVKVISEVFGQEIPQEYDFPRGALMGWGAFLANRKHPIGPGVELAIEAYAPSQALNVGIPTKIVVEKREDIEIDGTTVSAYKAKITTTLNGADIVATAWVDEEWEPIKQSMEIMGLKFDVVRCDKETALTNMTPVEMFTTSLLPVGRALDRDKATAITFRIHREDGRPIDLPATGMQTIVAQNAGGVTVRVQRQQVEAIAAMPKKSLANSKEYLDPSVFINSTDPDVIKMANRAAGTEADPLRTADLLRRTVSSEVKYVDLGTGFASAAEVCRSKVGDCTENGVLLAALGRVRGIPSRVVTGLIYVPRVAGQKDIMGFHMWTQFWINGQWVDLDAAWDQTLCDPTHIALGTHSTSAGSLASLVSGAMLQLDDIRIEVVKVEQ